MASPGGPNEIGQISIGVNAPVDPLVADLEKMKQVAQQKGEEVGKAAADGMQKGAASSPAGRADRKEMEDWFEKENARARKAAGLGDGGDSAVSAGVGAAVGAAGAVVGISALAHAVEIIAKIAPAMVDAMFSVTKQQLELKDALARNTESLQRAAETMAKSFDAATAGNPNISSRAVGRIGTIDKQMSQIDERLATFTMRDAFDYSIGAVRYLWGGQSERDQLRDQREELSDERTIEAKQVAGIRAREKMRGTIGGIARAVSGDDSPNFGTLGTVGQAEGMLLADLLRNNNQLLQELVRASTQSYQQSQQRAYDALKGVEEIKR